MKRPARKVSPADQAGSKGKAKSKKMAKPAAVQRMAKPAAADQKAKPEREGDSEKRRLVRANLPPEGILPNSALYGQNEEVTRFRWLYSSVLEQCCEFHCSSCVMATAAS